MDRYGVCAMFQAFLHGSDQCFGIAVGRKRGGSGKMDNQADILASAAVRASYQTLVHQDGVSAGLGHVVDGLAHVDKSIHQAHCHAMIHGNNNRATCRAI